MDTPDNLPLIASIPHILQYKINEFRCLWSSLYECVLGLKVKLNVSEATIEHCN